MIQSNKALKYKLKSTIAFEKFKDGGILFVPGELKRIKLNKIGAEVIALCDGNHSLQRITREVTGHCDIENHRVVDDITSFLEQLQENGLVEIMKKANHSNGHIMYRNPDVSCRDEPPEGAILFNPDTHELMAINSTGLLIWQILDKPGTRQDVLNMLREKCEGIPEDSIEQDIDAFIENLKNRGFLGVEYSKD